MKQGNQHVQESVIIIPKVKGTISRIPPQINGKQVRLGYSTPTKYAGTKVSLSEFKGRSIHCLGGSPKAQRQVHAAVRCDSVDGNDLSRAARNNQFFSPARVSGSNPSFPTLHEAGIYVKHNGPYLAFELSMIAYVMYWENKDAHTILEAQSQFLRSRTDIPSLPQVQQTLF